MSIQKLLLHNTYEVIKKVLFLVKNNQIIPCLFIKIKQDECKFYEDINLDNEYITLLLNKRFFNLEVYHNGFSVDIDLRKAKSSKPSFIKIFIPFSAIKFISDPLNGLFICIQDNYVYAMSNNKKEEKYEEKEIKIDFNKLESNVVLIDN